MHCDSIVPFCIDWRALEDIDHAGGDSPDDNKCSHGLERDIEPSLGEDAMIEVQDGYFDCGNCWWIDALDREDQLKVVREYILETLGPGRNIYLSRRLRTSDQDEMSTTSIMCGDAITNAISGEQALKKQQTNLHRYYCDVQRDPPSLR